ncbi:MAG TPA: ABC transporter permease [Thermomicrobiales bacterium]|jgi:ABC-2 type transport system permease protein/oleandomycin transport system permease protein
MDATADLRPAARVGTLQPQQRSRVYWALMDTLIIAKRNLQHIPRIPTQLLDVTVQPFMFVLLFRFVFGGAIKTGGTSYINYLMPGIFVQTLVFASVTTGVGLAEDLAKGLVDRFRSLPMARSAVLAGRTVADLVQSVLGVTVMFIVGMLVGFRPQGNPLGWIVALGLLLLCGFAFSWIGALLGMIAPNAEGVQAFGFTVLFPLTFASSAFVPTQTMPAWLRVFAEHQPVSVIINAARELLLGQPLGATSLQAFAWCAGILAIFAPVAVTLYRRKTSR